MRIRGSGGAGRRYLRAQQPASGWVCLVLLGCQPSSGAPAVGAPSADSSPSQASGTGQLDADAPTPPASASGNPEPAGPSDSQVPDQCPADTHRQWTCGRPSGRSPSEASAPVAVEECPGDSPAISQQWRMVSFPGPMRLDPQRTAEFRKRGKDEAGQSVNDVCCYSACVKLDVRATADPLPAGHTTVPLCIAASETSSSLPAPGRGDCAAAIKLPGYDSYGAFNAASSAESGPGFAQRAGFPEAKTCCYDGLQAKRMTR